MHGAGNSAAVGAGISATGDGVMIMAGRISRSVEGVNAKCRKRQSLY